jgi:LacI family transcriptional regulator
MAQANKGSIGIKEIAREAGVSSTTVSRVLNSKDGNIPISPDTRDHVMAVAKRLGYQRNPFASALRTNRTGIIGAVTRNFSGTNLSKIVHRLLLEAHDRDVELFVGAIRFTDDAIAGQLNILQSQLFDGLLLAGDLSQYQTHLDAMSDKPRVFVTPASESMLPLVTSDDVVGITTLLDYLVSLGHQHIGCVVSATWPLDSTRMALYRQYLHEHQLPFHDSYCVDLNVPYRPEDPHYWDHLQRSADHCAAQLMAYERPPTAIFGTSDGFAVALMKAFYKLGLRVPQDISVAGYNDSLDTRFIYPELTSISLRHDELAKKALDLLAAIIENPDDEQLRQTRVYVTPELILRDSCAPPTVD